MPMMDELPDDLLDQHEDISSLAYGSNVLRRNGLLNFSMAKPCYRQSAVGILTGASPLPYQEWQAAASRGRRRIPSSSTAHTRLSSSSTRARFSPASIGKCSRALSCRNESDDETCCKDTPLSSFTSSGVAAGSSSFTSSSSNYASSAALLSPNPAPAGRFNRARAAVIKNMLPKPYATAAALIKRKPTSCTHSAAAGSDSAVPAPLKGAAAAYDSSLRDSSAAGALAAGNNAMPAAPRSVFSVCFSSSSTCNSDDDGETCEGKQPLIPSEDRATGGSSNNSSLHSGAVPAQSQACGPTAAAAAAGRFTSARAAASKVLPKTYTAALLRRQEAKVAQALNQKRVKRACLQPQQQQQQQLQPAVHNNQQDAAAVSPCLSFSSMQSTASVARQILTAAAQQRRRSKCMQGVHMSSFRRVSLPCSAAAGSGDTASQRSLSPAVPLLAGSRISSDSAYGSGMFVLGSKGGSRRLSRSSSCSSCNSSISARGISRHGVPAAAATGRSMLLSALDAATAANTKATAALRAAARKAAQSARSASGQVAPTSGPVQTAAAAAAAAAAVPAAVIVDEEGFAQLVLGWYVQGEYDDGQQDDTSDEEAADDVLCVVTATGLSKQKGRCGQLQQQHDTTAAASGEAKQARPMCGVHHSKLQLAKDSQQQQQAVDDKECMQKGAQLFVEVTVQQQEDEQLVRAQLEEAKQQQVQQVQQEQDQQQEAAAKDSSAQSLVHCLLSPFWQAPTPVASPTPGATAAVAEDAAAAAAVVAGDVSEGGVRCEEVNGEAAVGVESVAVGVRAGCAGRASVKELLAASSLCIGQLESGFACMRFTAQQLSEAQLPLRERFSD